MHFYVCVCFMAQAVSLEHLVEEQKKAKGMHFQVCVGCRCGVVCTCFSALLCVFEVSRLRPCCEGSARKARKARKRRGGTFTVKCCINLVVRDP